MRQHPIVQVPSVAENQTAEQYGYALFRFLLASEGYGYLATEQLELAAYAGAKVSSFRGYTPSVYAHVSRVRHAIAAIVTARLKERVPAEPAMAPAAIDRPNIGPMARLEPAPIGRPPAGERVEIQF